jgi:4'-phosphopantetheinyl transferase
MPLILNIGEENYTVLVWKIEEDGSFFSSKTVLTDGEKQELGEISNEARKTEWLATRYLLQQLILPGQMEKNIAGKPILKNHQGHVSVSHCKGYTCCIYHLLHPAGIDIELVHPKIERIADRFLSETEKNFISKELRTEHLTAMWAIKETIYKMAGELGVEFKTDITIDKFDYEKTGEVRAELKAANKLYRANIRLLKIDGCILAYTP